MGRTGILPLSPLASAGITSQKGISRPHLRTNRAAGLQVSKQLPLRSWQANGCRSPFCEAGQKLTKTRLYKRSSHTVDTHRRYEDLLTSHESSVGYPLFTVFGAQPGKVSTPHALPSRFGERTVEAIHKVSANNEHGKPGSGRGAFTLIELLVVVAIIAILAGLLFPALTGSREESRRAYCRNNLRQIGLGIAMYRDDHGEQSPLYLFKPGSDTGFPGGILSILNLISVGRISLSVRQIGREDASPSIWAGNISAGREASPEVTPITSGRTSNWIQPERSGSRTR